MIRGLYTAAAGLITGLRRQESLANNLANVNTTGYKADVNALRSFPAVLVTEVDGGPLPVRLPTAQLLGVLGTGVLFEERGIDFSQGPLVQTGRDLDLALQGDGFFVLQGPNGPVYTRDGHFLRDANGLLVNADGLPVLDVNGNPVVLGLGPVQVQQNGLLLQNNAAVAQLQVVSFPDGGLIRAGDNTFVPVGTLPAASNAAVFQGYLEQANVNTAELMTHLVTLARVYESSQRLLQMQNETLRKAVEEVGRLS
ncbi:MAG TPA: flagellar hook-basal body protein [Dehalococcoidia bacterium]